MFDLSDYCWSNRFNYSKCMKLIRKIMRPFDLLEDKIRARLSRRPVLYAFIGSIGVVLIWRGIWMVADDFGLPGWASIALGVILTLATGLFVSLFIGDRVIISGLKKEKRIDEKTEEDLKKEEVILTEIKEELKEIKEEILDNQTISK